MIKGSYLKDLTNQLNCLILMCITFEQDSHCIPSSQHVLLGIKHLVQSNKSLFSPTEQRYMSVPSLRLKDHGLRKTIKLLFYRIPT